MGRPRKQPARILTANIPISTWDELDALRLTNRSVWLNRVILDEIGREKDGIDAQAKRAKAEKASLQRLDNPADQIARIPNRTLLLAALARINYDKKRLRGDLAAFITSMTADEMKMTQMPKDKLKMEYIAKMEEVNRKLDGE